MVKLRNFLPGMIHFYGRDKSGYAALGWMAPWAWDEYPEDEKKPWVFHLDFDWWDPELDARGKNHPSLGFCGVHILGFYWTLIQGGVEAAKGTVVATDLYLPPQLEILDRLTKGRFRSVLYDEWVKGCEAEFTAWQFRKISEQVQNEIPN